MTEDQASRVRIKLYLNTERHHEGVETTVILKRMTGSTPVARFDRFRQFCFNEVKAHTPVMRIYKFPSHAPLKSVRGLKEGSEYLVVGKEYTMGRPDHRRPDYPRILRRRRVQWLRARKAKRAGAATPSTEDASESPSSGGSPAAETPPAESPDGEADSVPVTHRSLPEAGSEPSVAVDDLPPMAASLGGVSRVGRLAPMPKFGYVGSVRASLRKVKIRLFRNTDRNHVGLETEVPLARLQRGGANRKTQLERFKQWTFEVLKAHTPTQRVLEVPSHRIVRRLTDLKPMREYLVVGKEIFLGDPDHFKRDYPVALATARREYLRRNPQKARIVKVPRRHRIGPTFKSATNTPFPIAIYLYTSPEFGGLEITVDVNALSEGEGSLKLAYQKFLDLCYECLRQVTVVSSPIIKVLAVPSHKLIDSFRALRPRGAYLCVGREGTAGEVSHESAEYPLVLVELRAAYVRRMLEEEGEGELDEGSDEEV